MEGIQKTKAYGANRYIILTVVLSLFGWIFETSYVFLRTGHFYDSGFLTTPICPIYGCSLLAAYFFLGTPDEGGLFLKNTKIRAARYSLYLLFSFLIPTVAELLVGFFFDGLLGVRLWSYESVPLNYRGYISLPVSVAWSGLIFLFMKYLFLPIKNTIGKLPDIAARPIAFFFLCLVVADLSLNFAKILF